MKTVKTTIIILLIALGQTTFASSYGEKNTTTTIEKEIKTTLKKIDLVKYNIEEETAKLTFSLNSKNEIVLHNIDTKSKRLEIAIREQLNGMISKAGLSKKTNYIIKISFVVLD